MTEETYSRGEVDSAIEAAFRLGFGNALAEVDGTYALFLRFRKVARPCVRAILVSESERCLLRQPPDSSCYQPESNLKAASIRYVVLC